MVPNVFVVDQAAQTYNIYLTIYVPVGNYVTTEVTTDARGHTLNPLETRDFTTFLKYWVFHSKFKIRNA